MPSGGADNPSMGPRDWQPTEPEQWRRAADDHSARRITDRMASWHRGLLVVAFVLLLGIYAASLLS